MAEVTGRLFTADADAIVIFDEQAQHIEARRWGGGKKGDGILVPVRPNLISQTVEQIQKCLAGDKQNGVYDNVKYIQVTGAVAIYLYIGGWITLPHMRRANEGKDYIDVPNFLIDGDVFTLRIHRDPPHPLMTLDARGKLV